MLTTESGHAIACCNQCRWHWEPRVRRPRKCPNPKCQAYDWDGPVRQRRYNAEPVKAKA